MEKNSTQRSELELARTFNEVWRTLYGKSVELQTDSGTPFVVRAKMAKRRSALIPEKVLVFLGHDDFGELVKSSRCYSNNWGHYFNDLGASIQRVGMFTRVVDARVSLKCWS